MESSSKSLAKCLRCQDTTLSRRSSSKVSSGYFCRELNKRPSQEGFFIKRFYLYYYLRSGKIKGKDLNSTICLTYLSKCQTFKKTVKHMSLFSPKENRVRCGRCNTEFDLSKNPDICPLCGFGKHLFENNSETVSISPKNETFVTRPQVNYLSIPNEINLPGGKIVPDEESKIGLWGMINDLFSGKALLRINSNLLLERKVEFIPLDDVIETSKLVITQNKLGDLKGFPNPKKESSIGRLVYHFISGFHKMGLFEVKLEGKPEAENIWKEDWKKILIRPTREGLQFARLKNKVFDEKKYNSQVLTAEEKEWLVRYLQKIDKEGFKEYTVLVGVLSFIKQGNNGNKDLWAWFKKNPDFVSYVKSWSAKKDDPKAFEKQLDSLAQTFSSGKISLLRELGTIKDKRNDYTVIGDLK